MEPKIKDWDKVTAVTNVVSKVVIAAASVVITFYVKNASLALELQKQRSESEIKAREQQTKDREVLFRKVETLQALLPGLADQKNVVRQRLAVIAIGEMAESRELIFKLLKALPETQRGELAAVYGDQVVAAMLSGGNKDPLAISSARAAYGVLAATPSGSDGKPVAWEATDAQPGKIASAGVPEAARGGWAYLGYWDGDAKAWTTRYFDFDSSAAPSSLAGKELVVSKRTGAINVRRGVPDIDGKNRPVQAVLRAGTKVKTAAVWSWKDGANDTGYLWAQIAAR